MPLAAQRFMRSVLLMYRIGLPQVALYASAECDSAAAAAAVNTHTHRHTNALRQHYTQTNAHTDTHSHTPSCVRVSVCARCGGFAHSACVKRDRRQTHFISDTAGGTIPFGAHRYPRLASLQYIVTLHTPPTTRSARPIRNPWISLFRNHHHSFLGDS